MFSHVVMRHMHAAGIARISLVKTFRAQQLPGPAKLRQTQTIGRGQRIHQCLQARHDGQGRMAAAACRKLQLLKQQFYFVAAIGGNGAFTFAQGT